MLCPAHMHLACELAGEGNLTPDTAAGEDSGGARSNQRLKPRAKSDSAPRTYAGSH